MAYGALWVNGAASASAASGWATKAIDATWQEHVHTGHPCHLPRVYEHDFLAVIDVQP